MPNFSISSVLSFTVSETSGIAREAEPICFGLPVAKGLLPADSTILLVDVLSGELIEYSDIRCSSKWSDETCRWLLVNAVIAIPANGECRLNVVVSNGSGGLREEGNQAVRQGGFESQVILADKKSFDLNDGSCCEPSVKLGIFVTDVNNIRHGVELGRAQAEDTNAWYIERNRYSAQLELAGKFLHLTATLTQHQFPSLTTFEIMLHNSSAARHPRGLWDLGDPQSLTFNDVCIELESQKGMLGSLQLEDIDEKSFELVGDFERLSIVQYSSGGNNDKSQVHSDKSGLVPFTKSGYELIVDEHLRTCGRRSQPTIVLSGAQKCMYIRPANFWQSFPSGLHMSPQKVMLDLFASNADGTHELQPGERASKSVVLRTAEVHDPQIGWQPAELSGIEYLTAKPSISILEYCLNPVTPLDKSLIEFLNGPEEFYRKREVIDEYGWRNYGEVFADHESLYVEEGGSPLVSHYNNQYDLIMGFGLQYMRTHDARWFQLMNDLVKHVIEIDVYKTSNDRVEYNNGLFWHTNHYESAETATHRTFSIKNYNPDQPRGSSGGPGAEHCYTSGLALHYFLTGDQRSADETVSLARWIDAHLNGGACFLASLHSIAKDELRRILRLVKGEKLIKARYPFTRGTGNYLRACLDAFAVTSDRYWIDKADNIVVNTFHSQDDIDLRNLGDIEGTWFHTIFLQEVHRYLIVKDEIASHDLSYSHAQSALIHYSRWMLHNAEPYLNQPDVLEFVNDTWAAQDMRRYMLFLAASRLDVENTSAYEDKAEFFADHIEEKLRASTTCHLTRIQAILLQNSCREFSVKPVKTNSIVSNHSSAATISGEIRSSFGKLCHGLRKFHLAGELKWIRGRL